ncbi:MAG: pseudouridine synthase [Burkholderiales bacterium]|jgi:16S rRNA pseudouridine516 synthase
MTLDKILRSQGFGSRKQCCQLIWNEHVSVAGRLITDADEDLPCEGLVFSVRGKAWTFREHLYIGLHKPPGYECSRKPSHHPGILTLLPQEYVNRNTQPVGRLDHDTTGLLLLSDDGGFIHAQSSPKRHVPKTYEATVFEAVTPQLIAQLQEGVKLVDEEKPIAAQVRMLDTHLLELSIDQGKYHQVKRMLAAAGNHCVALRRSAIGQLTLDSLGLPMGQWCHLEPAQLAQLV